MTKNVKLLLCISLPFLLQGCITANINSTKDKNHTEKIDNLLVVMRGVDKANSYFIELKHLMKIGLEQKGIKSNYHILQSPEREQSELSLDNENNISAKIDMEIAKQIKKHSSNYLMIINQTEFRVIEGNINSEEGGNFDIRLFKAGKEKMIWRAKLEMFSHQGFRNGARISYERIIEKLKFDALI